MKEKIVLTNSAIIINDYNIGDAPRLENAFKCYEPVTHSHYYLAIHYDEKNRRLYLPRGIDLWFVENCFDNPKIKEIGCSKYNSFNDIFIKYLPRDDTQKETLRFMLGKQEYRATCARSQLSVNLSTGKGKTYVSIATMAYLGIRTIVITDSVSWLNQWRDRTLEYTNIDKKDIFHISGSGGISRLMNSSKEDLSHYKLFLVTHSTLQDLGSNNGWESVTNLFEHLGIGIKIFDEAHLNFANMCMIDYFTNVFKTYYLTATPARSSDYDNKIYQLFFKNIPAIDLFDIEQDPHTNYVAIHYNSRPTPLDISNCRNGYGLNRNGYANYVVTQDNFHKLLTIILDIALRYTSNPGDKFLMYIGTNEAIYNVYYWIIENFPELSNDIGVYTSVVSKQEKEVALTKRLILSTTKSAGAAVDIPGLKLTVVLAEPFKSEVIARQTLGRTRANNTMYIEIVDRGFNQCTKYYYAKLKIFEKYASDCSIIRLSDNELDERYNKIMQDRKTLYFINAFTNNTNLPKAFNYTNTFNAFGYIL